MTRFYKLIRNSQFCHSIPNRCFSFRNHRLPICSRCLGILIGGIIFITLSFFLDYVLIKNLSFISLLLVSPAVLDYISQETKTRISNNKLRFVTGFLLGAGIIILINNLI